MGFLISRWKHWLSTRQRAFALWMAAPGRRLAWLLANVLHPRRLIFLGGGAVAIAGLVVMATWLVLFHSPWGKPVFPAYDKERVRPIVIDAEDRLIGLWPSMGRNEPPYLGSAVYELPEYWWKLVVLLEDANRDRWYHLLGIDWSQWLKIPVRALLGRANSGGSTLEMQLAKTLFADTDVTGILRVGRKLRDILVAPAIALEFDELELSRWAAAHFPFTTSGPHGLETASWLLFGRPAAKLDLARQAVLAAALRYRVDVNVYSTATWERAQRRWRLLLARAELALDRLVAMRAVDQQAYSSAVGVLHNLELPTLTPPTGLRDCLEHRSLQGRDLAARKLDVLAKLVARGELIQARFELIQALGEEWRSRVAVVRFATDRDANCYAKWQLQDRFDNWIRRLGLKAEEVQLVVAVADEAGRLVRFYANSYYPQYLPYRLNAQGRIRLVDPALDVRTIGSVGKVFAALLLGQAGDHLDDLYYRLRRERVVGRYPYQHRESFRNADGFKGVVSKKAPRAPIAARFAFARSDNLAVMERLARLPDLEEHYENLLQSFGFTPQADFSPVIDLPLGRLHGAPQTVHGLFAQLADPASRQPVCQPVLVTSVRPRLFDDHMLKADWNAYLKKRRKSCTRSRAWLRNAPGAVTFAHQVLTGVLDPALRGTASSTLGAFRHNGPLGLPFSIAKTGTVNASYGNDAMVRWVWLAGAFQSPTGERYSYVAQAGPVGRAHDLGRHASGGQLGRLLVPIFQSLPGLSGK